LIFSINPPFGLKNFIVHCHFIHCPKGLFNAPCLEKKNGPVDSIHQQPLDEIYRICHTLGADLWPGLPGIEIDALRQEGHIYRQLTIKTGGFTLELGKARVIRKPGLIEIHPMTSELQEKRD